MLDRLLDLRCDRERDGTQDVEQMRVGVHQHSVANTTTIAVSTGGCGGVVDDRKTGDIAHRRGVHYLTTTARSPARHRGRMNPADLRPLIGRVSTKPSGLRR